MVSSYDRNNYCGNNQKGNFIIKNVSIFQRTNQVFLTDSQKHFQVFLMDHFEANVHIVGENEHLLFTFYF